MGSSLTDSSSCFGHALIVLSLSFFGWPNDLEAIVHKFLFINKK
jgi:hypothetical protein